MSEPVKIKYCLKCANSGLDINNNVCECQTNVQSFYDDVFSLDVPEQYRGVRFNKVLLPKDMHESYGIYLETLHNAIITQQFRHHNVFLCSPIAHGKSVMAYSAMERLFRKGIPTFPVYDVLEIKRILTDMDLCRKQFYEVDNPEMLLTVPILFCKVPRIPTWEVYDMIATIVDRRVRRSNSTIFMYDGSWYDFQNTDKRGIVAGIMGDGTFNTIEVKAWASTVAQPLPEVQLSPNMG